MTNHEAATLLIPIRNDFQRLIETTDLIVARDLYALYVEALEKAMKVLEDKKY